MKHRKLSWWRRLVGLLLIYLNAKFLLFPQTRTLQASNADEATGMMVTDVVLIAVGVWLLATCYRIAGATRPK